MIHPLITLFSRLLRGDDPATTNKTIFKRAQDCPVLFQHDSINLEAKLFQYFYIRHGGMVDTFVHNRERPILDT